MTNNSYLKPGIASILFHSLLIFLLIFCSQPEIVAPAAENIPLEVEVEPAQLIFAPSLTGGQDFSASTQGSSGSAPSSAVAPPKPPAVASPVPKPEPTRSRPVAAKAEAANTKPLALPGGTDNNSVGLPALMGGNGGAGALGNGTGANVQGGGSGYGTGSGNGNKSGNGNGNGSGSGSGDGNGYTGASSRYSPKPGYPAVALKAGHEGPVLVRIHIDEDGIPSSVTVLQSSGYAELDEAAIEGISRWRFSPARRGREPVASSKDLWVRFRLEDA